MVKYVILSLLLSSCTAPKLPQGFSLEPPKAELFPVQDYNQYLGGKLKGQSANFVAAAEKHGVNVKTLIAISLWETGNGTSGPLRKYNNVAGAKRKGKLLRYASVKESIYAMAKNLGENYKGRSLVGIGKKYCPRGTSKWVKGVREMMKKLK